MPYELDHIARTVARIEAKVDHDHDLLHAILDTVRSGGMTPAEAEAVAERLNAAHAKFQAAAEDPAA